jgi:hypothetical protein
VRNALRRLFIRVVDAIMHEPPKALPRVFRVSVEELENLTVEDARKETAYNAAELKKAKDAAALRAKLEVASRQRRPLNGDA